MGKTEPVRAIGGWDPELKILEHKDIFLRMKAAGLKLAVCKGVILDHLPPNIKKEDDKDLMGDPGYLEKRRRRWSPYYQLLPNRYNVQCIFTRKEQEIDVDGNILFYDRIDTG